MRLVFIILFCLLSFEVKAVTTNYVSNAGSDANDGLGTNLSGANSFWKTVTHAASTASAGSTIYVWPGDYRDERVTTAKSGTSPTSPTIFVAWDTNTVQQAVETNNAMLQAFEFNDMSNIEIVGFNLSDTQAVASPHNKQVMFTGSDIGIAVIDCYFHNTTFNPIWCGTPSFPKNITIQNCSFFQPGLLPGIQTNGVVCISSA